MNDPLEALRSLTSYKAAVENAHLAGRPRDRSPILAGEADIPSDGMSPDSISNNFGTKTGIRIQLRNLVVKAATNPTTVTESSIFVALPQGADPKPNLNSELGQMTASMVEQNAALDSILDLRGTRITFEEQVHTFKGRKRTDDLDENGKNIWIDADFNVYFYRITRIQGAGAKSNGATPAVDVPVTQDDVDGISNFLANVGDKYEGLSTGNVLIQLKGFGVNTNAVEISKAVAAKGLRQFLEDRTATPVTA